MEVQVSHAYKNGEWAVAAKSFSFVGALIPRRSQTF